MRHAGSPAIRIVRSGLAAGALLIIAASVAHAGPKDPGGTCADCHAIMRRAYQKIVVDWKESAHAAAGVGCADCHGGDPTAEGMGQSMSRAAGFTGKPKRSEIPRLCARCHADPERMRPYNLPTSQFDQYQSSGHGKRLRSGDTRVATCVDCHGGHEIRRKNDPASTVYKVNVAKTCARCHSDATLMAHYGRATDQYAQYEGSVHGKKLMEERDMAAPSCADCHGTHGATPPGVRQVAEVCGHCHSLIAEQFAKGPHRQAVEKAGTPRCVDCHSNHGVAMPTDAQLASEEAKGCGSCHPRGTPARQVAQRIHDAFTGTQRRHDAARGMLEEVASRHEDTADGTEALAAAHTSLKEARANVHAVSWDGVSSQVDSANSAIERAEGLAREGVQRSYWRRVNVALAACLFLAISLVLWVKWSALHGRWLRQARLDGRFDE